MFHVEHSSLKNTSLFLIILYTNIYPLNKPFAHTYLTLYTETTYFKDVPRGTIKKNHGELIYQ
jgi:hypothetical protein